MNQNHLYFPHWSSIRIWLPVSINTVNSALKIGSGCESKQVNLSVFFSGGRMIKVSGQNLDVVQEPRIRVTLTPLEPHPQRKKKRKRRKSENTEERESRPLKRLRRIIPEPGCPEGVLCTVKQVISWSCIIQMSIWTVVNNVLIIY